LIDSRAAAGDHAEVPVNSYRSLMPSATARLHTAGRNLPRRTASRRKGQDKNRVRSFATQTPALVISALALALSLGGGAYAASAVSEHAPAAHLVSWHNISLHNGWKSSNSIYATGDPRVSTQNGIVYLSGSLHQSTPGSAIFTVLPRQYRPAHNMWITVYTNGGTSGTLYTGHNGTTEAFSSSSCGSESAAQCYTSLATVSYPVNS
jgi:hypothetical protein